MIALIVLVAAALSPSPAAAVQPTLVAGDTWRYRNTTELRGRFNETHDEASVVRVMGDTVALRTHQIDSTLQPTELLVAGDWSRFRSVNGKDTVVNRPFAFPLAPGKAWTVDFTENNPNRNHASEHLTINYKVMGTERVTVPAGSFDTVKVEASGQWTATLAPAVTGSVVTRNDLDGAAVVNQVSRQRGGEATGHLYKAFWYAPSVKRAVKVVEEYYDSNGIRSESHTSELESFTPGG